MKFSPFLAVAACALLGACAQFRADWFAEPAPKPMAVPNASAPAGVQTESADRPWATFKGLSRTSEGGLITTFTFSEKQGDALLSPLAVHGDALTVTGQFFAKGASQWGGVGVSVGAPRAVPVKAGDYKFLTIRLSSATSTRLRVRLVGPDEATQRLGCYPTALQTVKPEMADYRIALDRFAPEGYCGPKGIAVKPTLENLTGIEVAEVAAPVRDRSVSFGVGAIALAR